MKRSGAKHKLCRRIGECVWGNAKCPSAKRPYPSGSSKSTRRSKLSTYGELLREKQKLRSHYDVNERQLRIVFQKAKAGTGSSPEQLLQLLETRLASVVYRAGFAPTIHAAKQFVSHRHILVDGHTVDRAGFVVQPGQTVAVNAEKSAAIVGIAQNTDAHPPEYLEVDKTNCRVKLARVPMLEEIPTSGDPQRVIEYYAR